mmetsp:Transcript_6629/g.16271  ORF Transcript_6629/g.16271 Transcript_6629/m.16271 type:complete len:181 (-) Transcript_6629:117-659(-)
MRGSIERQEFTAFSIMVRMSSRSTSSSVDVNESQKGKPSTIAFLRVLGSTDVSSGSGFTFVLQLLQLGREFLFFPKLIDFVLASLGWIQCGFAGHNEPFLIRKKFQIPAMVEEFVEKCTRLSELQAAISLQSPDQFSQKEGDKNKFEIFCVHIRDSLICGDHSQLRSSRTDFCKFGNRVL